MNGIVNIFILICIVAKSSGCKQEWDPTCKSDKDCCSKICYKRLLWNSGFCINGTFDPPKFDKCAGDNFKGCIADKQCCSNLCVRGIYDQFGTCKSKNDTKPLIRVGDWLVSSCEKDGFAKCTSYITCCSGFCEKLPYRKTGVCKPNATRGQMPSCLADGSTECSKNEDCCSRFCNTSLNILPRFGTCEKSRVLFRGQKQAQSSRSCWDDLHECTFDNQCCSGICKKQKKRIVGYCRAPIINQSPSGLTSDKAPAQGPEHAQPQINRQLNPQDKSSPKLSVNLISKGIPAKQTIQTIKF